MTRPPSLLRYPLGQSPSDRCSAPQKAGLRVRCANFALGIGLGLALGLVACEARDLPPAARPVPAAWRVVRESRGHTRHMEAQAECGDCHTSADYTAVRVGACVRCHGPEGQAGAEPTHTEGIHTETAWVETSTAIVRETRCFDCHDFRGEPREPWDCLRCHGETAGGRPPITVHVSDTCRTCHHPHRSTVLTPKTCASCHEKIGVAHGAAGDARACATCHAPHRPAAEAKTTCASCHQRTEPKVGPTGAIPKHTGCTSCHAPHAPAEGGLVPCQSCHTLSPFTHGAAALGPTASSQCTLCHVPHAPDGPPKMRGCLDCHGDLAPSGHLHAEKLACTDCHQPHRFEVPSTEETCRRCHAPQPAQGHPECTTCHVSGAHAPREGVPACAACHAEIARAAPKGHAECGRCHQQHGRLEPEQASCARCHEDITKRPHGALEGGCARCHEPHARAPVARCLTCHEPKVLPALHQIGGHARCAQCHATHAPPRSERSACLRCHSDRSEHQPEATRCTGCHPFAVN